MKKHLEHKIVVLRGLKRPKIRTSPTDSRVTCDGRHDPGATTYYSILSQSRDELDVVDNPQLNHSSVCDLTGYSGTDDLQKSAEGIGRAEGFPKSSPARKRSA